jgi:hypothetical protein
MTIMCQRHISNAQLIEQPKNAERTFDGLTTFDTVETSNSLCFKRFTYIIGCTGFLKDVRIFIDQSIHQIDLFHETDRRIFALMLTISVNRPELNIASCFTSIEVRFILH